MYELDTNLAEIRRKFARAVMGAMRLAEGPHAEVDRVMRSGIQNHFNRLSLGGGVDPFALGRGTGNAPVRWIVARHPYTVESHQKLGVSPNQLLILTGRMFTSFTTAADVRGVNLPWGSEATLRSSNPDDEEKARKNLGGEFLTDFPHIGRTNVLVNFPRRQFVYWDALMRYRVEQLAQKTAESEWSGKEVWKG